MPEESYSFASTRARLEDIVSQVRKKETSLEKSLDLLEEGVRLANQCTELIDHADWDAAGAPPATESEDAEAGQDATGDVVDAQDAPADSVARDAAADVVVEAESSEAENADENGAQSGD